jgi:hypothetical protein
MLPRARQSRHNGAHGYFQYKGRLLVAQLFKPDKQQYFALIDRQTVQRALKVPQKETVDSFMSCGDHTPFVSVVEGRCLSLLTQLIKE